MQDTPIQVLAELERVGREFEFTGTDAEVKIRCPFHSPDDTPTCNINTLKGAFYCHACKAAGDIIDLLARILDRPRAAVMLELATRYVLDDVKIVEAEVVMRWHESIWQAGPLLAELRKRCISDTTIKFRRLGVDKGRITIPIPNIRGDWVNVRSYLPGATGAEKMRNMRGRGEVRLYPEDQLRHPRLMITGGEIKALAGIERLNEIGVGVLCATQAEGLLPPELLKKFAGKPTYVAMDVDAHGRAANEANLRALHPICPEVYDVIWPLDTATYPKGDLNDFLAAGGNLCELIESLEPWKPTLAGRLADEEPEDVTLSQAGHARYTGKRVKMRAIVQAMGTAGYPIPKEVTVKCNKDAGPYCALCPVWPSLDMKFQVPAESDAILECIDSPKSRLRDALIGALGIPRLCRVSEFQADTHYNAEDVRLVPQLEITSRAADTKMQPAICVGEGLQLNESYELTGRMYPHPATQQATLLISKYETTQDALSTYKPEGLDVLTKFRPAEWTIESLQTKLDHIYSDFEQSVTRIKFRRDMHLLMDLAYHSALHIKMSGKYHKGWVDVLIVGDSAQGKSECAEALQKHYGLGEIMSCKNATVPGILGGLSQMGTKWFVAWGMLVMHDKRLLILEEAKGMSTEMIGRLTDTRSRGVAELQKIEKRKAPARCRLIWLSNVRPERPRPVSSYGYPVEVVKELIGSLEDVRRFDACLIQSADDVNAAELQQWKMSLNGSHTQYDPDICRALILWAWTRGPDEVIIDKHVSDVLIQEAARLCERFTEAIPLVDRGSMSFKLARLATALAARTFSTSDDMQSIVVRECHARYISNFLDEVYSRPSFGYLSYTKSVRAETELIDPTQLEAIIRNLAYPRDFAESILRTEFVDVQDIQDWCACDQRDARDLLSMLVRKHALNRERAGYRKSSGFVSFLKSLVDAKSLPERPAGAGNGGKF